MAAAGDVGTRDNRHEGKIAGGLAEIGVQVDRKQAGHMVILPRQPGDRGSGPQSVFTTRTATSQACLAD
jgi:hypothetical protein